MFSFIKKNSISFWYLKFFKSKIYGLKDYQKLLNVQYKREVIANMSLFHLLYVSRRSEGGKFRGIRLL
jgi:hypothetical protein